MKVIDVIIDLENTLASNGHCGNIEFFAQRLPDALRKRKFIISSVTSFASYQYNNFVIDPKHRDEVSRCAAQYDWNMVWSDGIADTAIFTEVAKRLEAGTLAQWLLLVTCDRHFVPIVQQIRASGRFVFVSGLQTSYRLRSAANHYQNLWNLIGGKPGPDNPNAKHPYQGGQLSDVLKCLHWPDDTSRLEA